jgi:hypothetical protein
MTKRVLLCCCALSACLTVPTPCRQHRCDKVGDSGSDAAAAVDGGRDGPAVDASDGDARGDAGDDAGDDDAAVSECARNQDCSEEAAPRCGSDNRCATCSAGDDCARFGKICDDRQCVQCTSATEVERCPDDDPAPGDQGPACDPVAKTCTGRPRGTVSGCGACISDSECMEGQRCLPMAFAGVPHGTYCLQIAPATCPAGTTKQRATSVLGVEAQYCFPVAVTTCEAIDDLSNPCTKDADCGAAGLDDGLCVGPDGAKRCTYECGSDAECFGLVCAGADGGGKYCNQN